MKKNVVLMVVTLLLLISGCSKEGSKSISIGPKVQGASENIALDPIKLDQPDFGQITSITPVVQFLNIRNVGPGVIDPVLLKLTGSDASFFSLQTPTCAALQPYSASVCTVKIEFNPANKPNRLYFAELNINGLVFPFSAELAIRANGSPYFQFYKGKEFAADTIDLGTTSEDKVITQVVTLRHLSRTAAGNLPLIMTSADFTLSRTSCPAIEINGNGCTFLVSFNPTGKANKLFKAPISVNNIHTVELRATKAATGARPQFVFLNENDESIDFFDFGTILIPEKKTGVIKIKNIGAAAGVPEIAILPNRIFTISENTCEQSLQPDASCKLELNVVSVNRVTNKFSSKVTSGTSILEMKAFIYSPSQCNLGTHIDPDKLVCVSDVHTEIIANGIKTKDWMPAPAPGDWTDYSFQCTQPNYELNFNADACIFKQRSLNISVEGTGEVVGGENRLYNFNTVVNLRAIPAPFYAFQGWEGGSCSGNNSTCTVTMNQVHNIRAVFYVPPLEITPNPFNSYINKSQQFSVSGGVGPYSYRLIDASGTLGFTGLYSGNPVPTQGTVEVKDSQNRLVNVPLNIVGPFLVNNASINVTTDSFELLGAKGGLTPYTYNRISGVGSPGIGGYNTGSAAGSAVVQIVDGLGSIQTVNVNVVKPLQVNPVNFAQEINKVYQLQITQGIPPYVTSKVSGVGSINLNNYTTGSVPGTAVLKVKDSMNSEVLVNAVVVDVFKVLKTTEVMETGRSRTINATGGLEPYIYSIVSGGGTIGISGTFAAPATPGTTVVMVKDSIGTEKLVTINVFYPLALNFTSWKMEINKSKEIIPTGGAAPYSFVVLSGKGRMTGNSYSSDSTTESVVEVTDSVGNKVQASFTVLPEFKLPKYQHNMLLSETYTIVPTGGLPPYSYSLEAGGRGTLSTSGVYSAPAVVTDDIVSVTDSLGSIKQINFKVVRPLIVTVPQPDIYVSSDTQVIVLDGLPPYTYRVSRGLGSIAATAIYSAPAGATEAEIEVTDSMLNKQRVTVRVYDRLVVTPESKNLLTSQTQQISTSGGKSPILYRIVSGPGSVNSSGLFSAGATIGDSVIEVKDSLSMSTNLNFKIVEPLEISPDTKILLTEDTVQLTATKGLPPYVFDVSKGSGSVDASGLYTAGVIADAVKVRVTDSMGNTAISNVQVILPLTIPNALILTTVQKQIQLRPEGGLTPYVYSIQSGGGSVSSTGLFTAPATPGISVVKIADSSFNQLTVTFDTKEALVITPQGGYLEVEKTKQYASSGGVPPYTYSVFSGPGAIDSSGLYTASTTAGAAVLMVTDNIGNTSDTTLQVLNKVIISPATFSVVISKPYTLSTSGGLPPYAYSVTSGSGSVSAGGIYTAPASPGSAVITVTDSLGTSKTSEANIVPALDLVPVASSVTVNQTKQFTASGGLPPYVYSVSSGGGSINSSSGLYTASNTPGSVVVKVKDSLDNEKTQSMTVVGPLTLLVGTNINLLNNQSYSILVTGGLEPYTYEVTSGLGSVTSLGVYTAPNSTTDAVVKITDSLGNFKTVNFKVVLPLVVSPTPVNIVAGQTKTFSVTQGLAPYSYTLTPSTGAGTFNSSTKVYTAGATATTATLLVKDAMNNQVSVPITIFATLQNSLSTTTVPSGSRAAFTITGGSGNFTVDFIQNANIGSSVRNGYYYAGYSQSNVSEQIRIVDNVTGETKTSSVIAVSAMPSVLTKIGSAELSVNRGSAVAHNNNFKIIGSPLLNSQGSVSIYKNVSSTWVVDTTVDGSQANEKFGSEVKILNNIVAISSPEYDGGEVNTGRVSIFRNDGSNWSLEEVIESSIVQADEKFGSKIALFNIASEEWLVVSSVSNAGGAGSGSVYFYKNNSGSWDLQRTVVGTTGDLLGADLDANNGQVIIGVPYKDYSSKTDAGEALVSIYSGGSWIDRTVRPSDATASNLFGSAVAIEKLGRIAVGAINRNGTASNTQAGAVYTYYKDYANLIVGEKITTDPFELPAGKFGKKIALIEDYMAVSGEKVEGVTVFDYKNVYTYLRTVRGNNTNVTDGYGLSFSASSEGLFVGSPNSGEAMLYTWGLTPNWPTGTDGDLIISSGQTINLAPGVVKNYRNLIIDAGGVLNITDGSAVSVIGVSENLVINGTINAKNGNHSGGTFSVITPNKIGAASGETVSYTISQSAGGNGGNSRYNGYGGGGQSSGNGGGGAGENGGGGAGSASLGGGGGPTTGGAGASGYGVAGSNASGSYGGGGGGYRGKHGQSIFFRVKGNVSGLSGGKIDATGTVGTKGGNGTGLNQAYTYSCNPHTVCTADDGKGNCTSSYTAYDTCNGTYTYGGGGGGGGAGGSGGKIIFRCRQEFSPLLSILISGAASGGSGTGGNSAASGGAGAAGSSGLLDNAQTGF